ncbi:hypothetical protein HYU16_01370 [Candidatus Woesearchaeota archaeon]|nr:hypothetical protein [Candidatus Woesearchaeota archaeon]
MIWPAVGFLSMVGFPLVVTTISLNQYFSWFDESAVLERSERSAVRGLQSLDARLYSLWDDMSQKQSGFQLAEIKEYCRAVDVPGIGLAGKAKQLCNAYRDRPGQAEHVDATGAAAYRANVQELRFLAGGALGILLTAAGFFYFGHTSDTIRKDAEKVVLTHPRQHQ